MQARKYSPKSSSARTHPALLGALPKGGHLAPRHDQDHENQRDALYEQVRNHLASIGDLWLALEPNEDYATAERLAIEFSEDFRLMADLDRFVAALLALATEPDCDGSRPRRPSPRKRRRR